jgi:hypothetical protein
VGATIEAEQDKKIFKKIKNEGSNWGHTVQN